MLKSVFFGLNISTSHPRLKPSLPPAPSEFVSPPTHRYHGRPCLIALRAPGSRSPALPPINSTACLFRVAAFITTAAVCTAALCNPYPFRPSMLPPCNTIGSQIGAASKRPSGQTPGSLNSTSRSTRRANVSGRLILTDPVTRRPSRISDPASRKNFNYLQTYAGLRDDGFQGEHDQHLDFGPGVTVDQYRRRLRGDVTCLTAASTHGPAPLRPMGEYSATRSRSQKRRRHGRQPDPLAKGLSTFLTSPGLRTSSILGGDSRQRDRPEKILHAGALHSAHDGNPRER